MWIINVKKICNINHIIFTKYICTVSNKNVYTSYLIIINHFSSIEIYNIKLVLFVKVSSSLTTDSHKRFNKWWYVWCSMSINCTNDRGRFQEFEVIVATSVGYASTPVNHCKTTILYQRSSIQWQKCFTTVLLSAYKLFSTPKTNRSCLASFHKLS